MANLVFDFEGFELARRALDLYKECYYRREHRILADNLVNAALTAGGNVAEVQAYAPSERGAAARRALDSINKLVFTVYLMKNEGIYTDRKIAPVIDLATELKGALTKYISADRQKNLKAQPAPKAAKPVSPRAYPQPAANSAATLVYARAPVYARTPVQVPVYTQNVASRAQAPVYASAPASVYAPAQSYAQDETTETIADDEGWDDLA